MIRTWVADIRPLLDETCYQEYYEHMPKFRQKKADALKLVQEKHRVSAYGICMNR